MRTSAKIDRNQQEIVEALRAAGASVYSLASIGGGCPDLLVGFRGLNILLEVKDGKKPPSQRRLTRCQQQWHERWRGQVAVVSSADEALAAIKTVRRS